MIKLMVIAGNNSKNLAKFLEQRGTFSVDYVYNNLADNAQDLLVSVLKVDKLVYVYQINEKTRQAEMNVRLDMQTLRSMLRHNKFFQAHEIVFLCNNSEYSLQAKQYFKTVMTECNVSSYHIGYLDSMSSFSSVYDSLIGVSNVKDFKNSYRNLYRRNSDDDSKIAYEPGDDRKSIIEAFDYGRLDVWEEKVNLVDTIEDTTEIVDTAEGERKTIPNITLPGIETEDVISGGDLMIITGDGYETEEEWVKQLVSSAILNERQVIVYDFTKRQEVSSWLKDTLALAMPLDIIKLREFAGSAMCALYGNHIALLKYVVAQKYSVFNTVFVITDKDDVSAVLYALGDMASCVTFVCRADRFSIKEAAEHVKHTDAKKILVLADKKDDLGPEEIKNLYNGGTIIPPFQFNGYENDWVYRKLLGGNQ